MDSDPFKTDPLFQEQHKEKGCTVNSPPINDTAPRADERSKYTVLAKPTSSEMAVPDDSNSKLAAVEPSQPVVPLNEGPPNQIEIPSQATNEDQQVNLLTKSYLITLNDIEEDGEGEEYEGDDESRFPNSVKETGTKG